MRARTLAPPLLSGAMPPTMVTDSVEPRRSPPVTAPPRIRMRPAGIRPLSPPMLVPPEAVIVPAGRPLVRVQSTRREVPSPTEMPAQSAPLSKKLAVPPSGRRVTSFPHPR